MATVYDDSIGSRGAASLNLGGGGWGGIPFPYPVGNFNGGGNNWEGLIGLAVAASLFGGDGFGRRGRDCDNGNGGDSVAALAAVIAALNDNKSPDCRENVSALLLAKLGSLEGQIPAANCELMLALQSAVAGLTAQGSANAAALTSQLNQLQLGQLVQSQNILTAISNVDTNVDRQACDTRAAVAASESRIIALITANQIAELNAKNVILANEVTELRSDARHNEHRRELDGIRINIENNNAAVAAQAQFQQQRQTDLDNQRIRFDFERLHSRLDIIDSQFARATNNSVNVGNTGAIGTSQTANPTNVRA
jgi:hypothetical protein